MEHGEITLDVGEDHVIILKGRGSAGYAWEWSVEGGGNIVSVSSRPVGEPPQAAPDGLPPPTFNLDTKITITGIAPGRIKVVLKLRRPWELEKPPLESQVLSVRVR